MSRYEKPPPIAQAVEFVKGTIQGLRNYVATEYLWVFAMIHHVNIYLITVGVWGTEVEQQTTFSIRLITSERFGDDDIYEPVSSTTPNTIAVYFHSLRITRPKDRKDTGHFEYLVDKQGRSCLLTSDDVVTGILHPALKESYRAHHINTYTVKWGEAVNKAIVKEATGHRSW